MQPLKILTNNSKFSATQVEDECNYFNYNQSEGVCRLFEFFDIVACQEVAGSVEGDINGCSPQPGSHTCDDFIDIDCTFPGEPVVTQPNFLYPVECQNVLKTLGESRTFSAHVSSVSQSQIDIPNLSV